MPPTISHVGLEEEVATIEHQEDWSGDAIIRWGTGQATIPGAVLKAIHEEAQLMAAMDLAAQAFKTLGDAVLDTTASLTRLGDELTRPPRQEGT